MNELKFKLLSSPLFEFARNKTRARLPSFFSNTRTNYEEVWGKNLDKRQKSFAGPIIVSWELLLIFAKHSALQWWDQFSSIIYPHFLRSFCVGQRYQTDWSELKNMYVSSPLRFQQIRQLGPKMAPLIDRFQLPILKVS